MLRVSKNTRVFCLYRKIRNTPTNPLKCSLKDPSLFWKTHTGLRIAAQCSVCVTLMVDLLNNSQLIWPNSFAVLGQQLFV